MFREEEMDVKTAVKILQYYGSDNAIDIAEFIEQQAQYAELGRLFLEALKVKTTGKRLTTIVCKELPPEVTKHYCGENCEWTSICQLRAELKKVEVKQDENI